MLPGPAAANERWKDESVFVSASTECWPEMEFQETIEALTDLEFTAVEIAIHESGILKPKRVVKGPRTGCASPASYPSAGHLRV